MKLLFVGTSRTGGGTESHFITLAKAMSDEGHDVAALVFANSPIHQGLQDSKVRIYTGVFRNAFDLRGLLALWKAVSDCRPDWIVGSFSKEYWPQAFIAHTRGVKLALFKHMDFPMRFVTHHLIPRMAHRFIVISEFMRKNFIARGIAPEHIQMLHNPLCLSNFQPDSQLREISRKQLGFAEEDVVVGFVGAMHPEKGMFLLCDALSQAMEKAPHIKAIWIGEGFAAETLQAYIRQSGFESRHTLFPWSKDVRPYYAAMDILAVPTLVTETFGRVSIEAQACGVPVLCSNLGGLPETLVPNVTGKLLPVGDVAAWRDAILELANNAELHGHLQSQGRDWVKQNFSSPSIAKAFTELLEQRPQPSAQRVYI
jgi:glycosyltransferase involved in cell wall biosynthesis